MDSYEKSKESIDIFYPILIKGQEEWLRRHWEDFNSRTANLEKVVAEEFGKVVKEIGLLVRGWGLTKNPDIDAESAEVLDYEVKYFPQSKDFRIKITKLKLPNGKIMDDKDVLSSRYGCPHLFLDFICGYGDEVHPKVEEFKKKYSVRHIDEPVNDCEHK